MINLAKQEIGTAWIEYLEAVLRDGVETFDSRENVLETNPIVFTLEDFADPSGIIEKFGKKYISEIYTRKMFSRELIPELNSTYGDRLFDNLGVNQIEWAINRLQSNQWAKSCFISLVIPNDPGPRIPCLSAIQFSIRRNSIQMHCTFRSQNVYNAYGNFLGVRALQEFVASELTLAPGAVHFFVNFPHMYLSDVQSARAIVDAVRSSQRELGSELLFAS